jgi:hypothetical protein
MVEAGGTERTYSGTLEQQHFAEFGRVVGQRLKMTWRSNWLGFVVSWLGGMGATFAVIRFAEAQLMPRARAQMFGSAEVAVLAVLTGAAMMLVVWALVARAQRRFYLANALREGGSYLGPRRYVMAVDGLRIEGPHGTSTNFWHAIGEVTEAPLSVLVWTDPGAAIMVPKNAVGDAAAVAAFITDVRARIAAANGRPAPV